MSDYTRGPRDCQYHGQEGMHKRGRVGSARGAAEHRSTLITC